jgi:hypothetical protein
MSKSWEGHGWQDTHDGIHLEANAAEQAIIQAAHELKERGLSLRQIGHALTERACIRHLVALGLLSACRTCGRRMGRSKPDRHAEGNC